jgi:hypothetical protein
MIDEDDEVRRPRTVGLFLVDEQRLVEAKLPADGTALLHRYNVALVQACLLRARGLRLRLEAPAPGRVCFAETGLHFEGGLTMIDHGQGLVTAYLHQLKVGVRPGQSVARGQVIGAVGQEGRATGPHLCWRMKWRDRRLDPMLLLGVRAPA